MDSSQNPLHVGRLLVSDGGLLLGIVTRSDLIRAIQTRQELGLTRITQQKPAAASALGSAPVGEMKYCIQCRGRMLGGTRFCPHCGTKQSE